MEIEPDFTGFEQRCPVAQIECALQLFAFVLPAFSP